MFLILFCFSFSKINVYVLLENIPPAVFCFPRWVRHLPLEELTDLGVLRKTRGPVRPVADNPIQPVRRSVNGNPLLARLPLRRKYKLPAGGTATDREPGLYPQGCPGPLPLAI